MTDHAMTPWVTPHTNGLATNFILVPYFIIKVIGVLSMFLKLSMLPPRVCWRRRGAIGWNIHRYWLVYKIVLVHAMTMCGQQGMHAFFHLG